MMSTRTMIATAALTGALAVPAGAQQPPRESVQDQDAGMMRSCMMMQHMMQGMHGTMMGGTGMEGMHEGRMGMQEGLMDPGMMGMMGAMHAGPGTLLRFSEALELTPAQTEQLESLHAGVRAEHHEHMVAAMTAHREASSALEGDAPDLDAYAAALEEAADHMVQGHVAMTRSAIDAREVLTPEQGEKLDEIMGGMPGMHGGMMQGSGMMRHRGATGGGGGSGHADHH